MRDFNLEAALRGEAVVTCCGYDVTDIYIDNSDERYPVRGKIKYNFDSEDILSFTNQGTFIEGGDSGYNLHMADEEPLTIQPEPTETRLPLVPKTLFNTIGRLVADNVQFNMKTVSNEIFINLCKIHNGFMFTEKYRGSTELLSKGEPELVRIIEMLFSNLLNKISTTQTS